MRDVTSVFQAEVRSLLKENAALRVALAEERLRVGFERVRADDLETRLRAALPVDPLDATLGVNSL